MPGSTPGRRTKVSIICTTRRIRLSEAGLADPATAPKLKPPPGTIAIAIANDSPIDMVDLAPNGILTDRFRIGVGAPWVGELTDVLYFPWPQARAFNNNSSTVVPVGYSATDLESVILNLYQGSIPPTFGVRRADLAMSAIYTAPLAPAVGADSTEFPVFGRTRWTLAFDRLSGAGTGFDYSVAGIERAWDVADPASGRSIGDGTVLASGTIGDANTEDIFSYEGPAFDLVEVTISAEVGVAEMIVHMSAADR